MSGQVVLVAGPPCSGKTTYVRKHAGQSDVLVDFDEFVEAEGEHRYDQSPHVLRAAHRRWLDALDLIRSMEPGRRAWVIWTAPDRRDRGRFRAQYGAQVVVLKPPMALCLARAASERPPEWQGYVRDWFNRWTPSSSGSEIVVGLDTPPQKGEDRASEVEDGALSGGLGWIVEDQDL